MAMGSVNERESYSPKDSLFSFPEFIQSPKRSDFNCLCCSVRCRNGCCSRSREENNNGSASGNVVCARDHCRRMNDTVARYEKDVELSDGDFDEFLRTRVEINEIPVEVANQDASIKKTLTDGSNRQYVPWEADPNFAIKFAAECSIEKCNCSDFQEKYEDTYSMNSSNNTLAEIEDIGSRVRSMEHYENEWSQFIADHFKEDTKAGITDDKNEVEVQVDETVEEIELITDKRTVNDMAESYEVIEWSEDTKTKDHYTTPIQTQSAKTVPEAGNTVYEEEIGAQDKQRSDIDYKVQNNVISEYCFIEQSPNNQTNDTGNHKRAASLEDSVTVSGPDNVDVESVLKDAIEDIFTGNSDSTADSNNTEPVHLSEGATAKKVESHEKQINNNHAPPANNDSTSQIRISKDFRVLNLETPPFISVNNIVYEGNPSTGEADVVGRGSFGVVYKARFTNPAYSHLPIVVKEFNSDYSDEREVIEEAQKIIYLQNTGYVPTCYGILFYGPIGRQKYGIVQELVGTGLTLEQMIWDRWKLPIASWFQISLQISEGLAAFHDKGILLNDIKTNNIVLECEKQSVNIKYIDFGLATDMRGKKYKSTKSLGDFLYLAPEVRLNGEMTTIASDIYSLGYMLQQIRTYSRIESLAEVADLCMDFDPAMRIPIKGVANLIREYIDEAGLSVN